MTRKLYIFNLSGLLIDKYCQLIPTTVSRLFNDKGLTLPYDLLNKYSNLKINTQMEHLLTNDKVFNFWKLKYKKQPDLHIDSYYLENRFNLLYKLNLLDRFNIIKNTKEVIYELKNQNHSICVLSNLNKENTNLIKKKLEKNNIFIDEYLTTTKINYELNTPHFIYKSMYNLGIHDINDVVLVTSDLNMSEAGKKAQCKTICVINNSSYMNIYTPTNAYNYERLFDKSPNDFSSLGNYYRHLSEYNEKIKNTIQLFKDNNNENIVNELEEILYL